MTTPPRRPAGEPPGAARTAGARAGSSLLAYVLHHHDWSENHLYTPWHKLGVAIMLAIDMALFGVLPGLLIWAVQIIWIPFWAAGVINGLGHFWGYRNFASPDASTNISPWGILIGGEELHNNHHTYPTSARLSIRWYEVDIGWLYIRILAALSRLMAIMPSIITRWTRSAALRSPS